MSAIAVSTADAPELSEPLRAARNALALGTALAVTSAIAMAVRLLVPRVLGPAAFGELRLAESFAEMVFVILTFGVDMQLRREAAVDPSRAKRYLMGLAVWRISIGAVVITSLLAILRATGAGTGVITVFVLLAIGQLLLVLNNSWAAYEHAAGDVRWLARTNFGVKLLWAGAMLAALGGLRSGLGVALAGLVVEAIRCGWLTTRAIRHHGLGLRPDVRLAGTAILTSLPFFVHLLAYSLYARLGVGWLGAISTDLEVGLFGAASTFAGIALIGMPLLSWVLVPSAARAAAQSPAHMDTLVAGALRASLLVAVPIVLVFAGAAAPLLSLVFGPDYAPAAPALRVLAPTFGLAYVSTVCAIALLQQGRVWTVASISIAGLALTVALDAVLIPWGMASLGDAGGAQGAAWATLVTEVLVTVVLAACSPRSWQNVQLVRTVGALAAGIVAAMLMPSPVWSAIAGVCCVVALGGVRRDDLTFVLQVLRPKAPVPSSSELS